MSLVVLPSFKFRLIYIRWHRTSSQTIYTIMHFLSYKHVKPVCSKYLKEAFIGKELDICVYIIPNIDIEK